jgi:oligopeptide transport system substrate-binding protein
MFETGQLDITDKLPTHKYKYAKAKYGNQLINDSYLSSYSYIFNTQKTPFTNKNLRKALSIAIDRNVIANSILGAGEKPLYEAVPYGIKNYSHNELYWQAWPRDKQIAEAKRLYKEAGYSDKNPLTVHILYNTSEDHKKIATAIASMWKKDLGVNAISENEEWKTMLDRRKNGDFEVLRMGTIADYNDASSYFNGFRSNDSYNASKYKNLEYDNIVNQAIVEMNPVKRKELMQKAGDILKDDMPVAPIYSYVYVNLVNSKVIGFQRDVMKNFSLSGVYIAEKNSLN